MSDPSYRLCSSDTSEEWVENLSMRRVKISPSLGQARKIQRKEVKINKLEQTLKPSSVFACDGAVVAANLDFIFPFTNNPMGIIDPRMNDVFTYYDFIDLFGNPGGFSEYVMWRRLNACGLGFGRTSFSRRQDQDWFIERFKTQNYQTLEYLEDETLVKNWEFLSRRIKDQGFSAVFGSSLDLSEFCFEVVSIWSWVDRDKYFVLRLPSVEDALVKDLVYFLSQYFIVGMVKPISSDYFYVAGIRNTDRELSKSLVTQLLNPKLKRLYKTRPQKFEGWWSRNSHVEPYQNIDLHLPLIKWGVPSGQINDEGFEDVESVLESDDFGAIYRSLRMVHPPLPLNKISEFMYSVAMGNSDSSILAGYMDAGALNQHLQSRLPSSDEQVEIGDIETQITTARGFNVIMYTDVYENLKHLDPNVGELIDRYSFIRHESLKFRLRDKFPGAVEAISSPLTHTFSNFYSLYDGDQKFGSLGTFDKFLSDLKNGKIVGPLWVAVPESKKMMDGIWTNLTSSFGGGIFWILPTWVNHPLVKWVVENGKSKKVKRKILFESLRRRCDEDQEVILGYTGREEGTFTSLLQLLE